MTRRDSADDAGSALWRILWTAVGLGCLLAFSRAFASGLGGDLPLGRQPDFDTLSLACSAARVAALAAITVLGCLKALSMGRAALAASGVVMAAAASALSGSCGFAEGMAFSLLAGLASGVVMLALLLMLADMTVRDIVVASLGGLLVGGLLIGGLVGLPALPASAVLAASGLVAPLALIAADPPLASCRADGMPTSRQMRDFPWFAALIFAISGCLVSLFYGAAVALDWNAGQDANHLLFGVAVVAVLAGTSYIVLQGEEVLRGAWIPLFAVLLCAMALASFDDGSVNPSVMGLLLAAVFSYHFLRWMVFPALIAQSDMPRVFICGLVLVATNSFLGIGSASAATVLLPAGLRDQSGFVAFSALLLLLVFAAALMVNRARLEALRLQVTALSARGAEPAGAPTIEERCGALAAEHGLTSREAEIFAYTARGHSSTFIAGQLVISASTVRFHQQNIYRKLGVHSRQELIALVDDAAR